MNGRWPALALTILLLAGCSAPSGFDDRGAWIADTRQPAQQAWPRVKILVIHYTAGDFDHSLKTLIGPHVSVHYLIPAVPPRRNGKPVVWQLVPESEVAWHAGISSWRGATRINDTSIGIELENPGYRQVGSVRQYVPFRDAQIAALIPVARSIVMRYGIAPQNVVAHADIAPQRKDDPGPLFPWHRLAQQGIGAWPDPQRVQFYLAGRPANQAVSGEKLLSLLVRYGYPVPQDPSPAEVQRVISVFQMHFRPARYDGQPDAESEAIAEALLEKYGRG